jgi:hypothetical protein
MDKKTLSRLAFLLAALCWILPVQAQEAENEGVAEVILITPQPGKGPDLEAAIHDYHLWIADKPGAFRYSWFQIETGPDTGKYIARTGDHNWSDFDAEVDWEDEAAEMFATNVAPLVESIERWYTEPMEEFSYWPESMDGYTLFEVENWYIKSGQYGNFRAGLEKIHKALSEGNFGQYYAFNSTASGAKGNQVTVVLPMKGYAGFSEKDPSFFDIVSQALGGPEAFEAHMSGFGETYQIGQSMLVRWLPDASDYGDEE